MSEHNIKFQDVTCFLVFWIACSERQRILDINMILVVIKFKAIKCQNLWISPESRDRFSEISVGVEWSQLKDVCNASYKSVDHFLSFAVFLSSCRNSNLLPIDVCFRFDSFYYLPASSRNYWQHCELKDGIVTKEAKLFLRNNCFKFINTTSSSTLLFFVLGRRTWVTSMKFSPKNQSLILKQ